MGEYRTPNGGRAASKVSQDADKLPRPLKIFLFTSVSTTVLSLLVAVIRTARHGLAEGFSPLWPPFPFFDYYDYYARFALRHSVRFFQLPGYSWYYPAGAIFVHAPFYALGYKFHSISVGSRSFLALVLLTALTLLVAFRQTLVRSGLAKRWASLFSVLLVAVSWPLYVAWQRGNVEGLVWALTGVGVWALARRRNLLAAVLLGVAASFKIYPGLFLAMLLVRPEDRRYVLVGIAVFLAVTLAGLWYLDPNIPESWHYVSQGVSQWTKDFSKAYPNHPYDHSLFAQIHLFVVGPERDPAYWLHRYYVAAAIIASALAWRIRTFPFANQVLFLSCAAITLPPISFDYTLCMAYLPLACLSVLAVRAAQQGLQIRGLALALGFLGLVIGPTTFALRTTYRWGPSTIKDFSLVFLIAISAIYRFQLPVNDIELRDMA